MEKQITTYVYNRKIIEYKNTISSQFCFKYTAVPKSLHPNHQKVTFSLILNSLQTCAINRLIIIQSFCLATIAVFHTEVTHTSVCLLCQGQARQNYDNFHQILLIESSCLLTTIHVIIHFSVTIFIDNILLRLKVLPHYEYAHLG
jgi:hypothetical protein